MRRTYTALRLGTRPGGRVHDVPAGSSPGMTFEEETTIMAARKNTSTENTESNETVAAPVARKPRAPKPITDLATANAAFRRAKKASEKAAAAANEANDRAATARAALSEAAAVLNSYLGEVRDAVSQVEPATGEDAENGAGGEYSEGDAYVDAPEYEG